MEATTYKGAIFEKNHGWIVSVKEIRYYSQTQRRDLKYTDVKNL